MNFREWLDTPFFGKKALTGTPAVLEALNSRQFSSLPVLGGTNIDYRRIGSAYVEVQNASYGWMYRYMPPVRKTVDYIARNASQLGAKVYERIDDDSREHRGDHPAAKLLRKPNPHTPGVQFLFELFADFLTYDNAYALKFRNPESGEFDAIVRLEVPMVGLVGRTHFTVEAYRIYLVDGTWFDVPPEDVLHWRGYNPADPRKGESKLETLREILAADTAARTGVTEIFKAGLSQPGWIERPLEAPPLDSLAFERLRTSVANQMATAKRGYPILEEGMKFQQGSITPEDAQYLQAREQAVEEVCSQYGMEHVPPRSEEERRQFYADVLPPLTGVCAAFLNLQILQAEYDAEDHYFEFGREKLMDEIYKTLTSASGRPVLLTNEARAKIDQPPVPTGDELVTPANVIVGDNPKPSTGVMPIQNPNGPPQDGSHRTEDVPTPPGKSLNGNGHHKAHLIERRARADRNRNNWGKEYEDIQSRHFTRQRNSIRGKNLSQTKALKALEDPKWDKELAAALSETSGSHFEQAGRIAGFRANIDFDSDLGTNYLAKKAEGSAKEINQTTREQIKERGITDAFAYAIGTRAAGAGKSYASDVASFAVKEAERQAPEKHLINISGGECPDCAPYQGSWPADAVPGWPGYHANCGCIADIS